MKTLFSLLCLIVFSICWTEIRSQSIAVSPNIIKAGSEVEVTISAKDFQFTTGATNCPDKLNVNVSNVEFQQGSGTTYNSVKPLSVSYNSEKSIVAKFKFLDYNNIGNLVLGSNSGCPKICQGCIEVKGTPKINVQPSTVPVSYTGRYEIRGTLSIQDTGKTDCLTKLTVDKESIIFQSLEKSFKPYNVYVSNGTLSFEADLPQSFKTQSYNVSMTSEDGSCAVSCQDCFQTLPEFKVSMKSDTATRGEKMTVQLSAENFTFSQSSSTASCDSRVMPVSQENIVLSIVNSNQYFFPSKLILKDDTTIGIEVVFPYAAIPGNYSLSILHPQGCNAFASEMIYLSDRPFTFKYSDLQFRVDQAAGSSRNQPVLNISSPALNFNYDSIKCPGIIKIGHEEVILKHNDLEYYGQNVQITYNHNSDKIGFSSYFVLDDEAPNGLYDVIVGVNSGCPSICKGCYERKPQPAIWHVTNSNAARGESIILNVEGRQFGHDIQDVCNNSYNIADTSVTFRHSTDGNIYFADAPRGSNTSVVALLPYSIIPGKYDIIIGNNTACPLECSDCLTVTDSIITPSFKILPLSDQIFLGQTQTISAVPTGFIWSDSVVGNCGRIYPFLAGKVYLQHIQSGYKILNTDCEVGDYITEQYGYGTFQIPSDAPIGEYQLIVSHLTNCTIASLNSVQIDKPYIAVPYTMSGRRGESQILPISLNGVQHSTELSPNCTTALNLHEIKVSLVKDNDLNGVTILADSVSTTGSSWLQSYFFIPLAAQPGLYNVIVTDNRGCEQICKSCYAVDTAIYVPAINIYNTSNDHKTFNLLVNSNNIFSSSSPTRCPSRTFIAGKDILISSLTDTLKVTAVSFTNSRNSIYVKGVVGTKQREGKYDVALDIKSQCPLICKGCFTVTKPKITKITPDSGVVNDRLQVYISGEGVIFSGGSPTVSYLTPSDVWITKDTTSFVATSASGQYTSIYANFIIPPSAPLGRYDVHLKYQDTVLTCKECLTLSNNRILNSNNPRYQRKGMAMVRLSAYGFSFTENQQSDCLGLENSTTAIITYQHPKGAYNITGTVRLPDSKSLIHEFQVPGNWPSGKYDIILNKDSDCLLRCKDCFTVLCDSFPDSFSGLQGPEVVCPDTNAVYSYSMPMIAGVKYKWQLYGGTITENTHNILSVRITNPSAYVEVTASSACGNWQPLGKSIQSTINHGAVSIMGNEAPCANSVQLYTLKKSNINYKHTVKVTGGDVLNDSSNFIWVAWNKDDEHAITVTDTNNCGQMVPVKLEVFVSENSYAPTLSQINYFTLVSSEANGNQWYKNDQLIPSATSALFEITGVDRYKENYYHVKVTNDCGTFSSAKLRGGVYVLSNNTSTETEDSQNQLPFALSPNPAENSVAVVTDQFTLRMISQLEIIDSYGRVHQSLKLTEINQEVNLADLPSGMYTVKGYGNGNQILKKLIIQK